MTDVDIQPLKQLAVTFPQLRIVLLNALMSCGAAQQTDLTQAGRVYFEIATLEGVGGISRLLKSVPAERVLFGSHAPFFVWESADLKLKESLLPEPLQELIRQTNARNLLEAHRR